MKILITSDSHGQTAELEELLDRHEKEVDAFYHCGDSELPASSPIMRRFKAVLGNCDMYNGGYPEELVEDFGVVKLFMTHGHLYRVKFSPLQLKYRAEEVGAQIILYGHTHVADCTKEGNHLFINPGSLRLPKQRSEATYTICEITPGDQVKVEFFNVDGEPIDSMSYIFQL